MATVTARKPRQKKLPAHAIPKESADERAIRAAEQYWEETRRPFPCLIFLAPLLIAYEIGVLWLSNGHESLLRNGADTWMRSWLYAAGVHQSFVLPIVVLALLLIWNFYGYFGWRVRGETLAGMFAESLIFAFLLVVGAQASEFVVRQAGLPTAAISTPAPAHRHDHATIDLLSASVSDEEHYDALSLHLHQLPALEVKVGLDGMHSGAATNTFHLSSDGEIAQGTPDQGDAEPPETQRTAARTLTFIGAGIYEEVLFRLLLLPACYLWFRVMRASQRASLTLSILTTSLMFALAHYIGPAGDSLVPYTFCFRVAAGVYFACLFVARGFGITVGTHAFYDLIVGVFWAY